MPRVVPSQVVDLIDRLFPWAKDQKEGNLKEYLTMGNSSSVAAILDLTQQLPGEFITLDSEHYAEYVSSVAALRNHLQLWAGRGESPLHRLPGLRELSPVTLIRQALLKCPDAFPTVGHDRTAFH